MSVSIRLARGGAKKRPYYRIVVANSRSPRDGSFIEKIGTYNPLLSKDDAKRVVLDTERAKHWLSVGAQPSDRVARFLDAAGVQERPARNNPNKGVPGDKAKERAEERATKAAEAAEAAAVPAAAPADDVDLNPAEEPVVEVGEEAAPAVAETVEEPAEAPVETAEEPAEPVAQAAEIEEPAAEIEEPAAESADAPAEGDDAAPVEDATGESAEAPAEGSDEAAPAEGAEHKEA